MSTRRPMPPALAVGIGGSAFGASIVLAVVIRVGMSVAGL